MKKKNEICHDSSLCCTKQSTSYQKYFVVEILCFLSEYQYGTQNWQVSVLSNLNTAIIDSQLITTPNACRYFDSAGHIRSSLGPRAVDWAFLVFNKIREHYLKSSSISGAIRFGRDVTRLSSSCRPSSKQRRNSWASCWKYPEKRGA